jgi:peroxiredoxin (alkyl hydroperoxide reductase subunit C)
MSLVGQPAPEWTAPAYLKGEEIDLNSGELNGKWYVLYFYPLDFTFI